MIPLMIDFTGKKVIIFGGGVVGARKARYFVNEANLIIFSRSFHPEFKEINALQEICNLTGDIETLRIMIRKSALVIAATSDPDLNERGDVVLPAKISGNRYTIGISTTGSVPAIARLIREELEEAFPDLDNLIELGEWIRTTYRGERRGQDSYDSVLHNALRDPDTRKALVYGQKQAQDYVKGRFAV